MIKAPDLTQGKIQLRIYLQLNVFFDHGIYCTSFMQTILSQIISQRNLAHFYCQRTYLGLLHFFFIKKTRIRPPKKQLQIKKEEKKTVKWHLTAIQLKKKVPNQKMHLIHSYRQFAMFLSIKLLHSFKITTKCTKWIYLHV